MYRNINEKMEIDEQNNNFISLTCLIHPIFLFSSLYIYNLYDILVYQPHLHLIQN